jgi:hypothetical protein
MAQPVPTQFFLLYSISNCNSVIPQLCYSSIVLFRNCVIPQLCYSAIVLFRTASVLFRNCVIPQLCCGITLLQNYYIAELQYCRVIYIFHLKILLAFFPIFQSQNRQNEAKEPKAKRSWCSKNDLKMI